MKMKTTIVELLVILSLILSPSIAFAQGGLQPPCAFHGTVQVNGQNVADGTVITATIGNYTYITTTGNSTYRVVIAQPVGKSYQGLTVSFKIGSDAVSQLAIWTIGGNVVVNLIKGTGPAQSTRHLSGVVSPNQTFTVSVTFTAPAAQFNSIGLEDYAPTGWTVQGNVSACSPNANLANPVSNKMQYLWFGPFDTGQLFIATYSVTVPPGTTPGSYTFSGNLVYSLGGLEQTPENIAGDQTVQVSLDTPVSGTTREVNGNILSGVTITLDGTSMAVSDQNGQYQILATATGSHTLVAHKSGFRQRTQAINIEGLGVDYAVICNFQGNIGLIPNAPTMQYALACINKWLYPPNPDLGLTMQTALAVINAWLYPVQ